MRVTRILVVAALILGMLTLVPGVAQAGSGASVDIEQPGIINRVTPSGLCLRSHTEADWEPVGPAPGDGDPVDVFTDFAAGKGEVEFGLVTPSGRFAGQSHHPCE